KEAGVSGTDTRLRPRLADVAQQAGVSPATASRVLTGSARVLPETRREVEEVIARLGYVRNRAPRFCATADRVDRVRRMRGQLAGLFRTILPAHAQKHQPGTLGARISACPAHGALAARLPDSILLSAQRPCGRRRSGQHARKGRWICTASGCSWCLAG